MLKKLNFYIKIGSKILNKEVVDSKDYKMEYDKVAHTYAFWLKEMSKFTEKIINSKHIPWDEELKILDFACGTGYITRSILDKGIRSKITAVDFSEKMLKELRQKVNSEVNIIHADGIEFLKNTEEKFDVIFFGWALSYFNYRELFNLFKNVLKKGGLIGIITNTKGTLAGIEEIFLKVMIENQDEVVKPMDIRFNLPKGKEGLKRWFNKYSFEALELEKGEIKFFFDTPEELLEWLNKTGALAGTAQIFKNYSVIKPKIITEIKRKKYKDGKYEINHKFAYGIFRRE